MTKKILIAGLIVLAGACVWLWMAWQRSQEGERQTRLVLDGARGELVVARDELAKTRAEAAASEERWKQQTEALGRDIAKLNADKQKMLADMESFQTQLELAEAELEHEQEKVEIYEDANMKLEANLQIVQGNLKKSEEQVAALLQTNRVIVGHLTAIREDYVALRSKSAELESKLNDLDALKEQMKTVKLAMRNDRVEERKRIDRGESATGNAGFLMRQGQWVDGYKPQTYPLIQDIRREP
jgi:chromosome segregation ATPase